ncbi:MAG TPA: DUF6263 family protein [Kofleriaceae bacterium]|nr:DUF6263 family protein [Kofleriaceae bacterium]
MKIAIAALLLLAAALPAAHAQPRPAPPKVTLLSAGKGPRHPLRYFLQTGTTDRGVMTMGMAMKNGDGGGGTDIVIPSVETDLTINMGAPQADGEHVYSFAIDDMRIVPRPGSASGMEQPMQQMLDGMKGMTGSALIDARGISRDASFTIPPGLAPEVRDMLEQTESSLDQMSAPLPAEPVGVGARWRIHTDIARGGMNISQDLTYQLVSLQADRALMKVTISQSARPQKVSTAQGSFDLVSYKGTGSGAVSLDLHHIVPDSKLSMKITQVVQIDLGGGGKQKVPSTITVDMAIARKL